jgi:hypothetical protein
MGWVQVKGPDYLLLERLFIGLEVCARHLFASHGKGAHAFQLFGTLFRGKLGWDHVNHVIALGAGERRGGNGYGRDSVR